MNTLAPPHSEPLVVVSGLTKRFPVRASWRELLARPLERSYRTVLSNVSFSVRTGEFFGLLGQNGAGKTTLFRILSTLVLPDGGSASVNGADVATGAAGVRSMVAPVIANERSLHWRLNARENLRLFAVLQGIGKGEVQKEIDRVLEIVQLTGTRHELVGMFSSGMRQRLLIARALLGTPRVLLLDEPTRSLDPVSSRDFRTFLRDVLIRQQGCTVLLATHDADDVWNLCDRVGVLHLGRLLAVERADVLREQTGNNVHRVCIREADLALAHSVLAGSGVSVMSHTPTADSRWINVFAELPDGSAAAAASLAALVSAGVSVAAFERTVLDLAGLIERVIATSPAEAPVSSGTEAQ